MTPISCMIAHGVSIVSTVVFVVYIFRLLHELRETQKNLSIVWEAHTKLGQDALALEDKNHQLTLQLGLAQSAAGDVDEAMGIEVEE